MSPLSKVGVRDPAGLAGCHSGRAAEPGTGQRRNAGYASGEAKLWREGLLPCSVASRTSKRAKNRRARGGRAVSERSKQVRRWLRAGSAGIRVDRVTLLGGSTQSAPPPIHPCPARASVSESPESRSCRLAGRPRSRSVTAWHRRHSGCTSTVPTPAPNCPGSRGGSRSAIPCPRPEWRG
jgi:hypothetical protein